MNTLKGKVIAILVVIIIAASAYALGTSAIFAPKSASADTVLFDQNNVTSIFDQASPAVFEIDVTQNSTGVFGRSFSEGQGSGFLIDSQGHILTNNHVVDGANTVKVVVGANSVDAKVLGTDPIHDLALLSVDASTVSGITPLEFADSNAVKRGQMAVAIGNPYGLDDTVTVGVVSGLDRTIENLTGMIQTDASLNPGNSGGPLLDVNGKVIGINTAIESTAMGASNIGFAVPSNVAKAAIPDLQAGKTITTPWIGISGRALTEALAQELGLSVNKGVYVATVVADSPAKTAGLVGAGTDASGNLDSDGDVITAIDGKTVASVEDILSYINTKKVNDTVSLTVIRGGNTITVQVTLGERPANVSSVVPATPTPNQRMPWSDRWPFNLLPDSGD
jgi:S1-C subfamily serine protease